MSTLLASAVQTVEDRLTGLVERLGTLNAGQKSVSAAYEAEYDRHFANLKALEDQQAALLAEEVKLGVLPDCWQSRQHVSSSYGRRFLVTHVETALDPLTLLAELGAIPFAYGLTLDRGRGTGVAVICPKTAWYVGGVDNPLVVTPPLAHLADKTVTPFHWSSQGLETVEHVVSSPRLFTSQIAFPLPPRVRAIYNRCRRGNAFYMGSDWSGDYALAVVSTCPQVFEITAVGAKEMARRMTPPRVDPFLVGRISDYTNMGSAGYRPGTWVILAAWDMTLETLT